MQFFYNFIKMSHKRKISTLNEQGLLNNEPTENEFEDTIEETLTLTEHTARSASKDESDNSATITSRETSWVWEFFFKQFNDKNEVTSFVCSICKAHYKSSNSSGTLAKHLYKKHNDKINNSQNTTDKHKSKPYLKTDKRYQQLTNTIVDFIVCCQLPFAIVDNPYFVTMLNAFDERYQVPCRQTIKNEIMDHYDNMHDKILKELEKTKKVSITCDIWTSITM